MPCKWIYKIKNGIGVTPTYKAWLVAKGFKQHHGVDFDKIFSDFQGDDNASPAWISGHIHATR